MEVFTSPPAVAAMISGLVALVSLIAQLSAARRNNREIEILRAELARQSSFGSDYLRAYLKARMDGDERQLAAYRSILAAAQTLRDKLRHVVQSPHLFERTEAAGEIGKLAEAVENAYSQHHLNMIEQDRLLAHQLKKACVHCADSCRTWLLTYRGDGGPGELPKEIDKLGDLQTALREHGTVAVDEFERALRLTAGRHGSV